MLHGIADIERLLGRPLFQHQVDFLEGWQQGNLPRACVYYPTGKGKTYTALAALALRAEQRALVVTPPTQQLTWIREGKRLGIQVDAISHAKFRQKDFRLNRNVPLVVDEFHMLGGHHGMGWKKLDRAARGFNAPLIIMSATPQYNDAERCYCVEHVLDPHSINVRDGLIGFIYRNCETEVDPFSTMPKVTGFLRFKDAEDYLKNLPSVFHLEDEADFEIVDIEVFSELPAELEDYGYDPRTQRIMASVMEKKHRTLDLQLLTPEGELQTHVLDVLQELIGNAQTPVLVFCNLERIAQGLARSLEKLGARFNIVTGNTKLNDKLEILEQFKRYELDILIGTSTLATGTDGVDKMCNTMIMLNDTEDAALRRQLVGRILPRGEDADYSIKQFWRIVPC